MSEVGASDVRDLSDLRVALFSDTWLPQLNGVTRTLRRLEEALRDRGAAVQVVTVGDPQPHDVAVDRWASVRFAPYPELRMAGVRVKAATAKVQAFAPTLVHAATPFGVGLSARGAARRLGVPLVSSYHTHFGAYARHYGLGAVANVGWPFLRWFHNGGQRTFAPTRAVANELTERGFRNVALWSRGVDGTRFAPRHRSEARREQWGLAHHDCAVLYVGRLAREKGLDRAIDAVRWAQGRLNATGHSLRLRLVLVGEGPYEAACRATAPPHTVFLGRLDGTALAEAFASADLFVFPSDTDTFGNVLLEAMASGLAVAAVHAPPTRELLGDGSRGLLAAPTGPALGDALLRLALTPTMRQALAARALAFARTQTWRAVFDDLFAAYREVGSAANGGREATARAGRWPHARRADATASSGPIRAADPRAEAAAGPARPIGAADA